MYHQSLPIRLIFHVWSFCIHWYFWHFWHTKMTSCNLGRDSEAGKDLVESNVCAHMHAFVSSNQHHLQLIFSWTFGGMEKTWPLKQPGQTQSQNHPSSVDVFDTDPNNRCYVHLLSSQDVGDVSAKNITWKGKNGDKFMVSDHHWLQCLYGRYKMKNRNMSWHHAKYTGGIHL